MGAKIRPVIASALLVLVAAPSAQAASVSPAAGHHSAVRAPALHFDGLTSLSRWRRGALSRGDGLPRALPQTGTASGWTVEPTPNPRTLPNASLVAESCRNTAECTAVGSEFNGTGTTVPLAERWSHSRWHVLRSAYPPGAVASVFTGVSCTAPHACTAVGYYYDAAGHVLTLVEGWNGHRWRVRPTPALSGQGNGFFAVSCTAPAACIAVGVRNDDSGISRAVAERWNGTSWSVLATPISVRSQPSELLGISCTAARACTAVGATDQSDGTSVPLAIAWDGLTWAKQATYIPSAAGSGGSGFTSVSCTSASACTAAGSYIASSGGSVQLAERWNGAGWANQVVPNPAHSAGTELLAVSCTTANACVAVGNYQALLQNGGSGDVLALAEDWNGSAWHLTTVANPAGSFGTSLAGLSCTRHTCAAIGSYLVSSLPAGLALAEAWNGTNWSLRSAPDPAGANASELRSDVCTSSRACIAVGLYAKNSDVIDTLAEVWNGARWQIQPTPNPARVSSSAFTSVSCPSARACIAVGQSMTSSGGALNLAEAWNGSRWIIQPIPDPAGNQGLLLNAVSCSSLRACFAVGFYDGKAGNSVALVERWNGARWRIVALPAAAKQVWLNGVSCPSARDCAAVGYLIDRNGNLQPLAEAWNGTSWRVQPVPLPRKATGGFLSSVSCLAPTACTATGASFGLTGAPLAESWNGSRWRSQSTIAPPGFEISVSAVTLTGVSCSSARACTAVGDFAPGGFSETFAETWNGTRWSLGLTAVPPGTVQNLLTGVSCLPATCTAVGAYFGLSGVVVTLAETEQVR